MNATLLDLPIETPETAVSCVNCPAVQRLERALEQLRTEFRREVNYWKTQHARALQRIEQLNEELEQSRGQVHDLQDKLFGRKSEKSVQGNRSNVLFDREEVAAAAKKRGAQPGHAGHGRRDYSHLPVTEEFVSLPDESLCCPICGKPAARMSDSEDSEVLEIDVRAPRRRIRRRRYRAACDCDPARRTLTAPPPAKLIPKGNYGVSIWVLVLLDKYSSYRPTERLQHPPDSAKFQEQDALLRRAVDAMRVQAVEELSNLKLRQPCRKVLQSLQEHWTGLTRFVEGSRIPMDNNASERAGRGPAVARKNFYGSGSLWSGRLAAMMFSLLATLAHWKINPRLWLLWYLESCAAAGGKTPDDIQPFLPWNLSPERHAALAERATFPSSTADTS